MFGIFIQRRDCSTCITQISLVRILSSELTWGFRYTHKIAKHYNAIPQNASWIKDGFYYVIRPRSLHHIGHFSECLNHLLLKFRFPSIYPPLTDLYIPEFKSGEYEWSKTYMHLVLDLFPNGYAPKLHLYDSINISELTCFKSAVFSYFFEFM